MVDRNEGERIRPLLDLDADVEPSGAEVRIGGKTHYFKSDDELTISDRENLLLFSIRLREIRETPPADGGLLPDDVEGRILDMQRRVLRIALPTVNRALIDDLDPLKVHGAVQAFIRDIRLLSWLDRMTAQQAMTQAVSNISKMSDLVRKRTSGATTSPLTSESTDESVSETPTSKPDSTEDTDTVVGVKSTA